MGGNNMRGGPRNDASPIHQADYGKLNCQFKDLI